MLQRTLSLNGERISLYESEGTGQPLLFVHGNSASGRTFAGQFDRPLGRECRMAAIDLPGHGDSPRPSDPQRTYSFYGYAQVVAECARALDMANPVLIGWSLGGHIILEAARHIPGARGFVIFGAPPLGHPPAMAEAFLAHEAASAIVDPSADERQVRSLINAYFASDISILNNTLVEAWLRTDGQARAMLGQSFAAGQYTDEIKVATGLTVPLAVLHGEKDRLVNGDYLTGLELPTLWRKSVQMIPNAGHAPHLEQPKAFNSILRDFVADLT